MNDPVVVVQQVDVVFQRVLQRSRLVSTVRLGRIGCRHDDLPDARVLCQIDGLVRDDLDDELVEADVQARVHVSLHVLLDQIGIVAARDNAYADERRQERRTTNGRLLGEHVVDDEAAKVANA